MAQLYTFLVLEEHPYGREMLRALLDADLEPNLIIEERSELADIERDKFYTRFAGYPLAPKFDELLAGRDVLRAQVGNHNSKACATLLAEARPDLMVLGGTRILRPRIFGKAGKTLNAHPGLLPEVRGSASVAWAIARDIQIGCTSHLIDAGIDTGPIVKRQIIPVHRGDTYEKLCFETCRLSAVLMREAVQAHADGTLVATPQPEGGVTHRNMPDDQVEEVKRKLAEGRYAHFAADDS